MTKLSFSDFMHQIDHEIQDCSTQQLRKIIYKFAEDIPTAGREDFVKKIKEVLGSEIPALPLSKEEMIDELSCLLKDIENYEPPEEHDYSNHQWEDQQDDSEPEIDEELVDGVNFFLKQAVQAYRNSYAGFTKNILEKLLIALDVSELTWSSSSAFSDELEVDLDETKALYLSSLYLTSPAGQRPATMINGFKNLSSHVGDSINLQAVMNADIAELPDLESFLSGWITELKKQESHWSQYLLQEAVKLTRGTEGLVELALADGKDHPQMYITVITALEKEEQLDKAVEIAKKGLASVPVELVERAGIAHFLVKIGQQKDDDLLILEGARESFKSDPTLANYVQLHGVAEKNDCLLTEQDKAINQVKKQLEKEETKNKNMTHHVFRPNRQLSALLVQMYLFSQNIDEALQTCKNKEPAGWTSSENPESTVLPFLLKLFSGPREKNPFIDLLWSQANCNILYTLEDKEKDQHKEIMQAIMNSIRITKKQEERYINWCERVAKARINKIVGSQFRESYEEAVLLLKATAEMLNYKKSKNSGESFEKSLREEYSRHRAFLRILKRL